MNTNTKKLIVVAVLAVFASGCETLQSKTGMSKTTSGAVAGGALGCAGGAILTHLAGGNAFAGCAVGGALGALVGYEQARQAEIAEAEEIRKEAVAALNARAKADEEARLAAARNQGAKIAAAKPVPQVVSSVKTKDVTVTDKKTGEKKVVKTLDEVTFDIPVSMRGTPEHTEVMGKLRTLATRMADQRGSAEILVSMTERDARAAKVSASSNTVKTDAGNTVTVMKRVSGSVPTGIERVTVKPGKLSTQV